MKRFISLVTLVVDDYDRAINYYTKRLGFILLEDTPQGHKRWVRIAPSEDSPMAFLLAQAKNPEEVAHIGNQTGGRVGFFLQTDDFERDYQMMLNAGVNFKENPRYEDYGTVAVFADLYGNLWDLLQVK